MVIACDLELSSAAILPTAGAFARRLGESFVALHAFERPGDGFARAGSRTADGDIECAAGALRRQLAAAGVEGEAEVVAGDAAAVIVARARELRASLIVLGTHDRVIGRGLLGTVSEAVLRDATCSVLILRVRPATVGIQAFRNPDSLAAAFTEALDDGFDAADKSGRHAASACRARSHEPIGSCHSRMSDIVRQGRASRARARYRPTSEWRCPRPPMLRPTGTSSGS